MGVAILGGSGFFLVVFSAWIAWDLRRVRRASERLARLALREDSEVAVLESWWELPDYDGARP